MSLEWSCLSSHWCRELEKAPHLCCGLHVMSNSWPDIAFTVHQCACFMHNPKQSHAVAVKCIVRYLSSMKGKGLCWLPCPRLLHSPSTLPFTFTSFTTWFGLNQCPIVPLPSIVLTPRSNWPTSWPKVFAINPSHTLETNLWGGKPPPHRPTFERECHRCVKLERLCQHAVWITQTKCNQTPFEQWWIFHPSLSSVYAAMTPCLRQQELTSWRRPW